MTCILSVLIEHTMCWDLAVLPFPLAPTKLHVMQASVFKNGFNLTFVEPLEVGEVPSVSHYVMQLHFDPAFPEHGRRESQTSGRVPWVLVNGAYPSMNYYVRVAAVNQNGQGDWSEVFGPVKTTGECLCFCVCVCVCVCFCVCVCVCV